MFYASAIWTSPIARRLNGQGIIELRRFAIAPDSPTNTASRMLKVMRILIKRKFTDIKRLISYQDVEVHTGCIYRAAGWFVGAANKIPHEGWHTRMKRNATQTNADKIRWELAL